MSYSESSCIPSLLFLKFSDISRSPVVTTPSSIFVIQPITPRAHMRLAATAWNDSFCNAPRRCRRALVSASPGSTVDAKAATTLDPGASRYFRPSPVLANTLIRRSNSALTLPRHPSSMASTNDPGPRSDNCFDRIARTSPLIMVRTASTRNTDPSGARVILHRRACTNRETRDSASCSSGPRSPSDISNRSTPERNSNVTSR